MARLNKETGYVEFKTNFKTIDASNKVRLITDTEKVKKLIKDEWFEVCEEGWYVAIQNRENNSVVAVRKKLYNDLFFEVYANNEPEKENDEMAKKSAKKAEVMEDVMDTPEQTVEQVTGEVITESKESFQLTAKSADKMYIAALMECSLDDLTKTITTAAANARESVKTMSMALYAVKAGKKYKEQGFKNVSDYAFDTFGISKSTTHLYIQTVERFLSPNMKEELPEGIDVENTSFAALQELRGATNDELVKINEKTPIAKTSAKKLRDALKELRAEGKAKEEKPKENKPLTGKDEVINNLLAMNTTLLNVLTEIVRHSSTWTAEQMAELASVTLKDLADSALKDDEDEEQKTA